jgi:hypothetical protein
MTQKHPDSFGFDFSYTTNPVNPVTAEVSNGFDFGVPMVSAQANQPAGFDFYSESSSHITSKPE